MVIYRSIYTLIKYSSPGWLMDFEDKDHLIDVLRRHICQSCLVGPSIYVGEGGQEIEDDTYDRPIDVEYEGKWFYCRDIDTLLGTPCGCEFGVEIDGKPYSEN